MISQRQFYSHLIRIAALAAVFAQAVVPNYAQSMITINGRITDFERHPVERVEVRVWDDDSEKPIWTRTNGNGDFIIEHPHCKSCCLEVMPIPSSGLASALLENIAGDENRKIVITLRRGFAVSGKVVHDGKALRGIYVRAVPQVTHKGDEHDVHGGGIGKTGRDGVFHLVLTPGAKKLSIINNNYSDLHKLTQRDFSVTADTVLPDVNL